MEEKGMYQARLRQKGQLTLPKALRERLSLTEGDQLVFYFNEESELVLKPEITISADQAWFWTERWQKMEREAQEDIETGKLTRYSNVEEAIESLERET
ncbi:MAG: hypothetical protein MAG431_02227 [Chloroflexi bacterium]|nr:hypothetical protein [Chloroflexota bacterium]